MDIKEFKPEIWGPKYWFVLHTIAYSYPKKPNATTKRKYYDLILNLPLFIPNEEISKDFSDLLDKYPVTPYLDNKSDFQKWMHFIHNKVNKRIGKPQISLQQAYNDYAYHYRPEYSKLADYIRLSKHHIYLILIIILVTVIYIYGV
tara:strand:- start:750 stop:1187 length:438 start_codon:yes stop_codon:yes gene_type:complete